MTGGGGQGQWTVGEINPWSVLKVCAALSLVGVPLMVLVCAGLWFVASVAGVTGRLETFLGELLAVQDFRLRPARLLGLGALMGYGVALIVTVASVVAVFVYNAAARLGARLEIRLREVGPERATSLGPTATAPGALDMVVSRPVAPVRQGTAGS